MIYTFYFLICYLAQLDFCCIIIGIVVWAIARLHSAAFDNIIPSEFNSLVLSTLSTIVERPQIYKLYF